MPRVPAYCPHCGGVFPSPINVGAGASVILENCATNCPFCGGEAQLEGEFQGAEEAILVIRSKNITPEALKAFAATLREAYEEQLSIEETKRRAAAINPTLGEAVEKIASRPGLWKTSLIALILMLSRCNFDIKVSVNVNDLISQLNNKPPAATLQVLPLPKPDPRKT